MAEDHEPTSDSMVDKITEKFHSHDSSSSSSSDSDNDREEKPAAKIYRLFGREKPVHKVLGGGKQDLLCYYGLSSANVISQGKEAERVMNALIRKAAEMSKKKASSASDTSARAEAQQMTKSPEIIIEEGEIAADSSRKRKAPGTSKPPMTPGTESGSLHSEAQPLCQVRQGSLPHARVLRSRSTLLEMYRDDLRLVGTDASSLAGQVLRDMASSVDADYMDSMGWAELATRANSAIAEAALLSAEVTFRANNFRKQYVRDSRVYSATADELEQKLAELSALREKENANLKRQEEEMRLGFESQRLKLQNDLRVAEVRLESALEEARKAKEEQTLAQLDADSARADLKNGEEIFKEKFLKSEEFGEIIGDKALGFLNIGFDGCIEQFKAAGYPPEGSSSDFLSIDKVLESLPPDM